MLIVTGGAGFIGSNVVRALNQRGRTDILVVDDLTDGHKFRNIADCHIADYMDYQDFLTLIQSGHEFPVLDAILHQGACSATTEWDGRYMMKTNFEYSKVLLHYALDRGVPFLYASSAAVYGGSERFVEAPEAENPLNVYGYSKLLFDQYVRRLLPNSQSQVAGFRYFNVYGPGEQRKGSMASVAFHLNEQLKDGDTVQLFEGSGGYDDGEQRRDFIYVEDVAAVNLWFLDNPKAKGVFNVGTGRSQSFNDVANAVIRWHQRGHVRYIPFPEHLKGAYQHFTEADISALRKVGYDAPFASVEEGVARYLDRIETKA